MVDGQEQALEVSLAQYCESLAEVQQILAEYPEEPESLQASSARSLTGMQERRLA